VIRIAQEVALLLIQESGVDGGADPLLVTDIELVEAAPERLVEFPLALAGRFHHRELAQALPLGMRHDEKPVLRLEHPAADGVAVLAGQRPGDIAARAYREQSGR